MKRVGAHVSIAGGVQNAPLHARQIGANAFAMFTKNQRQWKAPVYKPETIEAFKFNLEECGFTPEQVLPHDAYLINIGSPRPNIRHASLAAFIDELDRCRLLGLEYLNMHPGSHVKMVSEEECLDTIVKGINEAFEVVPDVTVVLENTAGQGSNVGYKFEHLAYIIQNVRDQSRMGVCLDTCHTFAAGYDIRTPASFNTVLLEFDSIVGLEYLKGIHLNDSKTAFAGRVDRHQSIGEGTIGLETFKFIMNDPRFDELPMILETIDESKWPEEILMLYEMTE